MKGQRERECKREKKSVRQRKIEKVTEKRKKYDTQRLRYTVSAVEESYTVKTVFFL